MWNRLMLWLNRRRVALAGAANVAEPMYAPREVAARPLADEPAGRAEHPLALRLEAREAMRQMVERI